MQTLLAQAHTYNALHLLRIKHSATTLVNELLHINIIFPAGKDSSISKHSPPSCKLKDVTKKYTLYLKSLYKNFRQKMSKWPPSDIKIPSQLAAITKLKGSPRENAQMFEAETVLGCADDIHCDKIDIRIEQLLDGVHSGIILVDGAPGIGKSTFALQVCQRWANGELLTDYDLMVLLRCHDKAVN